MIAVRPSISVLIPAYNEERVIGRTVLDLKSYLDSLKARGVLESYEIIVCINGTVDRTEEIVKGISEKYEGGTVKFFSINGKGMGLALREGIKKSSKEMITFVAADGEVLNDFIERAVMALRDYDFVSGSRYLVKSQVRGSSFLRRFLSISFAFFIRLFFSTQLSEVGTVKAFRREWAQRIVGQCKRDDPSWQVEILYYAFRDGLRVKEVPVYIEIRRKGGESKVKVVREVFSFMGITLKCGLSLRWNQLKSLLKVHI